MPRYIKNFIIIASLLLVSCANPILPEAITAPEVTNQTVEVRTSLGEILEVFDISNLSIAEQRTRAAAVKVRSLLKGGHGSGTYMVAYGRRVVITAAHVVRGESVLAIDGREGETVIGQVVFIDEENDIAFLVVPEMETRTAVRYRPRLEYNDQIVGTAITYTGFPSHHDLLTIRGYVASLERRMLVANMFGWFGASGSGIFDQKGQLLGIVSGIDVGNFGFRLPLESLVWIAPISMLDQEVLKIRILTAPKQLKAHSFPGAAATRRGTARD